MAKFSNGVAIMGWQLCKTAKPFCPTAPGQKKFTIDALERPWRKLTQFSSLDPSLPMHNKSFHLMYLEHLAAFNQEETSSHNHPTAGPGDPASSPLLVQTSPRMQKECKTSPVPTWSSCTAALFGIAKGGQVAESGWYLGDPSPCNLEVERFLRHSLPFHKGREF